MHRLSLMIICLALTSMSYSQTSKQAFVSIDIYNFWIAYDKIISTHDSVKQLNYLKELYLDKGSPGLKSLVQVRNYTDKEFIDAITKYPRFWASLRPNTLNYKKHYFVIEADIQKLKQAYPNLKPSTIYFCVGAFRTNGTIRENRILIGSELSLADNSTVIDELPEWRQPFYKEYEPGKNIALLCTHEYIHTQQKELVENLLSMCLYEGVAEFISCEVTGKKSNSPAINFGKANQKKIINQFVSDLFIMSNNYNWLWGENRNDFKVRDLGYYIGYEICERYYSQSKNKTNAIRELIELDYSNEKEVERIVNSTKLLPGTIEELNKDYESQRPTVVSITPFKNGSRDVKPGLTKITVVFSEELNGYNDGIDFGPLGQDHCPKIKPVKTWADNGKAWTFEADLKPNQHYQILVSNNFRKPNGVRIRPYLIDFTTTE